MYPLISVFIIVVGALLLVFANKIIKNNKVNRIGIKVVGGILIIVGLLLLYFLLSGKLTLPLSKKVKFQFTQQDPRLMFRVGTQGGGLVIVLNQVSAQSSG